MRAKGSGESTLLLLDAMDTLHGLRIPYVVIGALAASFHGLVRGSQDADALISLSSQADVKALRDTLQKAGLHSTYQRGDPEDPIAGTIHVEDRVGNRVDLLMGIRGVGEAVFARAVDATVMKTRIRVVGLEDFLAMKIFAGSPKDLADASGVLHVSGDQVNQALLNELVQPYGKSALRTLGSLMKSTK